MDKIPVDYNNLIDAWNCVLVNKDKKRALFELLNRSKGFEMLAKAVERKGIPLRIAIHKDDDIKDIWQSICTYFDIELDVHRAERPHRFMMSWTKEGTGPDYLHWNFEMKKPEQPVEDEIEIAYKQWEKDNAWIGAYALKPLPVWRAAVKWREEKQNQESAGFIEWLKEEFPESKTSETVHLYKEWLKTQTK